MSIRKVESIFGMETYVDDDMTGDVMELRDAETWRLLKRIEFVADLTTKIKPSEQTKKAP